MVTAQLIEANQWLLRAIVWGFILWTFTGSGIGWWTLYRLQASPATNFSWSWMFNVELAVTILASFMSAVFVLALGGHLPPLPPLSLPFFCFGGAFALPLAGYLWLMREWSMK